MEEIGLVTPTPRLVIIVPASVLIPSGIIRLCTTQQKNTKHYPFAYLLGYTMGLSLGQVKYLPVD